MEYKIKSTIFWNNLKNVYNYGHNWHLADKKIQMVSRKKLGLKYIDTIYDDHIDSPYASVFLFEVVNQEKLLWARLKYAI
jgi:hypothetical protein